MTLGDIITIAIVLGGSYPVARLLWRSYGPKTVNTSAPPAPVVMSRAPERPAPIAPVVLETDGPSTPDRPMMPVPTEQQMLDVFKVLREAGVKREALRGAWKAAGLPLNNNVWAEAAPDDDLTITPFAGRVTRRSYYQDEPDLEYQPPA
jgi:hypothetical protein